MKKCLCAFLLLALSACTTISVSEKNILHPDNGPPPVQDLGDGYAMDTVSVRHADGAVSQGIWLSNPNAAATVLYFGGNEFRIDRASGDVIAALAKAQVDIVIFDYRGYGRSKGNLTPETLMTDAMDVLRFVKAKAKNKVVVYGHSMGGSVAGMTVRYLPVDGVILEGAPTNVPELVSSHIPWYYKPFVRIEIEPKLLVADNASFVRGYPGALLVLAGEDDSSVPVRLQRALWQQAATNNKAIHVFRDYGHNGLMHSKEFPGVLSTFLTRQLPQSNAGSGGNAETR
jgi:pimeloyl-ACP methyl ester carboxylesterase